VSVNHRTLSVSQWKPRGRGFSMVEVLVAMVVMCIGLLGMAGVYVTTLQSGSSAIYRMQAVNLAADLGERIRANRAAVATYAGAAATSTSCETAACTKDQMAANDLFVWQSQIKKVLPGSIPGTVEVDATTIPATITIKVFWSESNSSTSSINQSYTMVMQQ